MKDIGIIGAGNLMGDGAHRPDAPEAARADRASPSTTSRTRAPPAPPRCGSPAWPSRRARPTWAWPSAWRSSPVPACWPEGAARRTPTRGRRTAATARWPRRRPYRHRDDAGRLRPDRHGVRPPVRRHQLRALRPDQREEPRALDAQPAGGLHEEDDARRDHERRHDRLPQHAADVLGQLRRCRGRRRRLGLEAQDAVARAAEAGGQDLGLGPDHRPVGRGVPDPARTSTTSPATRRRRPTSRRASARRTSTWWSCTTASPRPSSSTTTTSGLCERGGAADFFKSGATWRDGTTPVNVSGGLESKGHPIAATGIANVWEVATHLRGEAGDRQIEGAKVGLTHVIGLGSACGVHILEKSAA